MKVNHLKSHLKGKVVIVGVGNTLRSDDGSGSVLAQRLKGNTPFVVFDGQMSPENYLEKIIQEEPGTVVIIDAVDFGGKPGEFKVLEAEDLKSANLFFTHNASLILAINYLQSHLKVDIIILIIQPKSISLGDKLSPEIVKTIDKLESYFYDAGKKEG
ncbi:MAG: hydrogenase 3 maturation endopeptidase HyCI [Candidatus Omnitrophica bacterium]|nr:hydrogenase 3 maturation endopeptidase HyCI [Candidatus Omnitrophota bacterium]MBI5144803.1 hydrogenase 3 maturation endopeptidase HyCI [Candidatus Omnitrophota bacterium]